MAEHFYKTRLARNGGIQKSNLDSLPGHPVFTESVQYSFEVENKVNTAVEDKNYRLKNSTIEKTTKKHFLGNFDKNLSIRRAIEYGLKHKEDRTTEKSLKYQNLADLELQNLARRFLNPGLEGKCDACKLFTGKKIPYS